MDRVGITDIGGTHRPAGMMPQLRHAPRAVSTRRCAGSPDSGRAGKVMDWIDVPAGGDAGGDGDQRG